MSLLAPVLLGLILHVLFNVHTALYFSIVNFRLVAIPSNSLDVYNDFFSRHDHTYFCQISILRRFMSCPSYQEPLWTVDGEGLQSGQSERFAVCDRGRRFGGPAVRAGRGIRLRAGDRARQPAVRRPSASLYSAVERRPASDPAQRPAVDRPEHARRSQCCSCSGTSRRAGYSNRMAPPRVDMRETLVSPLGKIRLGVAYFLQKIVADGRAGCLADWRAE